LKPIPNLADDAAMALRGRRSTLHSARLHAAETLRNACTLVQGAEWSELAAHAATAREAAEQLELLATMWQELQ
jgi:hypothetical protein